MFTSDYEVLLTISGLPTYFQQHPDLSASYNSHRENEIKTLLWKEKQRKLL